MTKVLRLKLSAIQKDTCGSDLCRKCSTVWDVQSSSDSTSCAHRVQEADPHLSRIVVVQTTPRDEEPLASSRVSKLCPFSLMYVDVVRRVQQCGREVPSFWHPIYTYAHSGYRLQDAKHCPGQRHQSAIPPADCAMAWPTDLSISNCMSGCPINNYSQIWEA